MKEKKFASPADFTSRWEFSKATSAWHFDKWRNEDSTPPFRVIGWVQEDFTELVDLALGRNEPNTFENRLGGNGPAPYTQALDRADLLSAGYGTDHVLFHRTKAKHFETATPPLIQRVLDFFAMKHVAWAIHTQYPGQTFPLHIDNLTGTRMNQERHAIDEDPSLAARFEIQLTDWEWGHVWGYGNTFWKQWRKGEVVHHDWRDIPHYTANAGQKPRVTLQLTGIVTERTRELRATRRPFDIFLK